MPASVTIATGPQDLEAVQKIWPKRLGAFTPTIAALAREAITRGGLLVLRDTEKGPITAAAALNPDFSANSLYVPFIAVETRTKEGAVRSLRMMESIVAIALHSRHIRRIIFSLTTSQIQPGTVDRFNANLEENDIPLRLGIIGENHNLFNDGRDITLAALFIPKDDRPDIISATIGTAPKAVARAAAAEVGRVGGARADSGSPVVAAAMVGGGGGGFGGGGVAGICCSGCNETEKTNSKDGKDGKDKEGAGKEAGKEGKEGKEGSPKEGADLTFDKNAIEKSAVDSHPDLFVAYRDAGINLPPAVVSTLPSVLL